MRFLVTGGAGFIGSRIALRLRSKGYEVIVLDNLSRFDILGKGYLRALEHSLNLLKEHGIKIARGDIRRYGDVLEASEGVECIVHAAAQVAVTTSLRDPRLDFEINALGTLNVLEAARVRDACVLYTSTNKVYGENVNKIPLVEKETRYEYADPAFREGIPEDFPVDLTGHTPYGVSKLAADLYVQDYHHSYGLRTGVFRMSCIYGEGQFGVEDQGWVAWFAIATIMGKEITIYGDGKQVRDILHVEDLVDAVEKFIFSENVGVFNIGGGVENSISLLELLKLLEDLTRTRPRVSFTTWRKSDQKVYISNIRKAKELLGWKPKIGVKEGIKRLVIWVMNNRDLFENYHRKTVNF
jgi:CDP-paratose 2-epimerase